TRPRGTGCSFQQWPMFIPSTTPPAHPLFHESVVLPAGALRKIRRSLQPGDLCELDPLCDDSGFGAGFEKEKAGFSTALSDVRLPGCTSTIHYRGGNSARNYRCAAAPG